jgi:hypothetical protein
MNHQSLKQFVENEFEKNAIPAIMDYIRIPNLSRNYDSQWGSNGLLEKAAHFLKDWAINQEVQGLKMEYFQEKGRTPTLFMEIPATDPSC